MLIAVLLENIFFMLWFLLLCVPVGGYKDTKEEHAKERTFVVSSRNFADNILLAGNFKQLPGIFGPRTLPVEGANPVLSPVIYQQLRKK